jgi:hypothetical protein
MDKIVVQNLTGFGISFQGRTIAPYGSEEFLGITDYVALSKLFNANKVLYTTKTVQPKKVVVNTPVKEDIKEAVEEVAVKEDIKEPVTETVEVPETKETVDTVKPYEELVNETKETKTSSKKNTKRNKDEK